MSSEYFGLIMYPFESGPDPRFLYMDGARRNVFAQLLSAVYECKGLVLLACRRGLGKSTLVRHLSDQLAALDSVLLLYPGGVLSCRPGMSFADILAACRGRLDRRNKSADDEGRLPATLEQAAGRGQAVALILDDADALDDAALARLCDLCQPDGDDRRLLSVILAGSAELPDRLQGLAGRGADPADLLLELLPLRDRDIERMVRHRLSVAGHADGDLFTPVALAEIGRRSRGEPLRVVGLCSAALALAEQARKATVSRELVERASERLGEPDDDGAERAAVRPASTRVRLGDARQERHERQEEEPRPLRAAAEADVPRRSVRRIDDVAEAIRAADRRSSGGQDPHIRAADPRSSGGQDPHIRYSATPAPRYSQRDAPASAEEHTVAAKPRGMSDQAYALYPGVRPSQTRPPGRRGRLGAWLLAGLLIALLAAAGGYAARTGMIDVDNVGSTLQAVKDRAVHLLGSLVRSDPDADESVAGISPDAEEKGAASADLGVGQFGPPPGREDTKPAESYDFAPPPPQGSGEQKAWEAPASPRPDGGSNATQDASARPTPAEPATTPPAASSQGAVAGGSPASPQAGTQAPAAAASAPAQGSASSSVLSSLRPPEMKPAPPQPPQSASASPRQAPARGEEPTPRPDAGRTQQNEPLLARGDEYLGGGDLDMARTFYQMAFERGSAEAAIRMGWTFDPQYFQRAGIRGEASPREAILWYQEALRRGSSQASSRLSDLATWLQSAAASGDLEAQRILRMWQG